VIPSWPVSQSDFQLRRATIEDVPALRELWSAAGLPAAELERCFTEFQVAENPAQIVGALGLRIAGPHGLVHGEAFHRAVGEEALRPLLWQRVLTVATNHGLVRLWTRQTGTFWEQQQFTPAGDIVGRLPQEFGVRDEGWFTLQLKDEQAAGTSLEKEFELFRQVSRDETEAMMRRAKTLKLVAAVVVTGVFILVMLGLYIYFTSRGGTAH
jgi:N-acetylglutamate synthase-like GNAT family acetyltransferase